MIDAKFIYEENSKLYVFLKFSKRRVLKNMKSGIWRFRHIDYYRSCKDKERGDENEGNSTVYQSDGVTKWGSPFEQLESLYIRREGVDYERVLCICKLEIDKEGNLKEQEIDVDKLKELGKLCCLIDYKALYEKLRSKYPILGAEDVTYYKEHSGFVRGSLLKEERYKHQHEHRIVIVAKEFIDEVKNNENLKHIDKEISKNIVISEEKSKTVKKRQAADIVMDKLIKQECKIKKDFYIDVDIEEDVLSNIVRVEKLRGVTNLYNNQLGF